MTSTTRSNTTTALAVAITAALFAAPSYAAMRTPAAAKPAQVQKAVAKQPVFSKPAQAYGTNLKAPADDSYDSFLVSFKKGAKPAADMQRQLDAIGKALGARITVERTTGTGAQLIRLDREIDVVARRKLEVELMKHPSIRAVEPNGRMYRAMEPNDPLFVQQWHYKGGGMGINATEAWDTVDGSGYIVAVLDTGELQHEDLTGQFVAGYDFISDPANARDGDGRDADPTDTGDWDDKYDSSWHGTHVAGTVAALTNNGIGVAGVAHGAKVQHVRVLGNMGGTFADINDAIVWASGGSVPGVPDNPTPAHIINLSLGGSSACSTAMQDAINIAIENGTAVIAAAGNSSANVSGFSPAGCEGVIAVAGTGPNNTKYASTNFGTGISVAAPAGSGVTPAENQVLSTLNTGLEGPEDDSYAWYAGTSMAAPHVAGTAALMMEAAGEHLPPDELEMMLQNTGYAANGLVTGCNTASLWCASMIDAGRAVAVADGSEPLPPAPPGPPPPPPPVVLENGVASALGPMSSNEERFFTLEVPANQASLVFNFAPGTGDSDLYVRYGSAPTSSTYDCRPYTGGAVAETCSFTNPQAGTWHVRISAYSTSDGWNLTGTYDDEGTTPPPGPDAIELDNGVAVTGISVDTDEQLLYFIDVPVDATDLSVQLSGDGEGDADLYVRRGDAPTGSVYDCRSWELGSNELCEFPTPAAGQWYVLINGYEAASGLTLVASYVGDEQPPENAPQNLLARYAFALRGQRIRVPLTWTGGQGEQVDVRFNGEVAATVANTGKLTHTFNAAAIGPGSATYQVCNAGTDECSAEITVNYTARR